MFMWYVYDNQSWFPLQHIICAVFVLQLQCNMQGSSGQQYFLEENG